MLTEQFLARIHLEGTKIDMKRLPLLLRHVAQYIPFENLDVMTGTSKPLSTAYMTEKILVNGRGGLCYEINPLLAEVLRENDLNVKLISATIYDTLQQQFSKTGYTHTLILLEDHEERYLIDAGFGNNVPLMPIPLNGDVVSSTNGEYKVIGDELFMKRRYRDEQFILAYRFKLEPISWKQLQISQHIIEQSEASVFNKRPLLTKCTEEGTITLSQHELTIMKNGLKTTETLTPEQAMKAKKQYFYQ
ncbi:arylamine N-acetyltransferase family protein [Kurthia massiliensis]|uniref:arylamine N-acetyltransferase family protein n=1 Tax=Kurthia massiliensis TaxID=1033739 RepID=UPI0002899AB3|nr:arylamine N-acetyltransferase [Kurthia massiliensis]